MSELTPPPADVLDELDFSPESYRLPVPSVDGFRASTITVRFVGSVTLDRTSLEDLEFVDALRLGSPVRAIVTGAVAGKGWTSKVDASGEQIEVGYSASVKIADVELGEPA